LLVLPPLFDFTVPQGTLEETPFEGANKTCACVEHVWGTIPDFLTTSDGVAADEIVLTKDAVVDIKGTAVFATGMTKGNDSGLADVGTEQTTLFILSEDGSVLQLPAGLIGSSTRTPHSTLHPSVFSGSDCSDSEDDALTCVLCFDSFVFPLDFDEDSDNLSLFVLSENFSFPEDDDDGSDLGRSPSNNTSSTLALSFDDASFATLLFLCALE